MRRRFIFTIALLVSGVLLLGQSAFSQQATVLHRRIDEEITAGLATRKVAAAQQTTDAEFVRRIHLDLVGVIPTAQVAREFIESTDKQKRSALIERLLKSDDFAKHWATVFDVLLMERRPDKYIKTPQWREFLAKSFAADKPLDQLIGEILGADGVNEQLRPAAKFFLDRAVDKDTLVRDISRLMLGMNLQCAQCHDHPDIDDYLHQHYHGLSVFVAGSKTFKAPSGEMVLQEALLREVEYVSVFDPETTKKTGPRLLAALLEVPEFKEGEEYVEKPSRTVRSVPKFSLRKLLSERLPSRETPEFARNMANRLWAKMMGRGIVHPLDMHHSGNAPSHPLLLDVLADQLVASDYNLRFFLREIALSQTYQRSSLLPVGVDPNALPADSFAVANMKGLSPEQLFSSLLAATQASAAFEQQIDEAIREEAATDDANADAGQSSDEVVTPEARESMRAKRLAEFIAVFGSVPGQPEGEFSSSLAQALFLANNETVAGWVAPTKDNLTQQLSKLEHANQIADEVFLSILSRKPTMQESQLVAEYLKDLDKDRAKAIAKLVWSQLASAEFRLNH